MDAALESLVKKYNLNAQQLAQFKLYLELLIAWNNKFNLTAITNSLEIIAYHFDDSLVLSQFIDGKNLNTIADVGSGGGFPGLPLKILYPHLKLVLIEVNGKKVEFLKNLVNSLGLQDVLVEQIDWRAFIREGQLPVDLFCARASLQVDELLRIFKPGCVYKNSKLVYWAAQNWDERADADLIAAKYAYKVGERERKLILFSPHGFDPGFQPSPLAMADTVAKATPGQAGPCDKSGNETGLLANLPDQTSRKKS